MQRLFVLMFAALAFVTCVMRPAAADPRLQMLGVQNKTDHSAWITVYGSTGWTDGWTIVRGELHPRCVAANSTWSPPSRTFLPGGYREIKVLAEVKHSADCRGGNITDTYDKRTAPDNRNEFYYLAKLYKHDNGNYNLWF